MDTADIVIRLGLAALAGIALGLNRDLHGKPTGVRTLGLVGLASALVVIAVGHGNGDASRVIQGIVTGIGFLGAGVIVRNEKGKHVHGLTTAACVWPRVIVEDNRLNGVDWSCCEYRAARHERLVHRGGGEPQSWKNDTTLADSTRRRVAPRTSWEGSSSQ